MSHRELAMMTAIELHLKVAASGARASGTSNHGVPGSQAAAENTTTAAHVGNAVEVFTFLIRAWLAAWLG